MQRHDRFEFPGFVLLAGALLLFAHSANAQFNSTVEGTILDPSKSAVPDAKVTVINQATQVASTSRSNNLGVFRVTTLPLGTYRMEIVATGFKPWAQSDLELAGGQIRTLNVTLEVGTQVEKVDVVGAAIAVVETGKATISTQIAATTIQDAPLLSRSVYAGLVAMVPGLTGTGASSSDNYTPEAGYGINAGGQPNYVNAFLLDGASVENASRGGQTYFSPAPDTVEAVKVSAADFSAEKGRFSGATMQVFTKSGTNSFHGNASEYHMNNRLQARTISQKAIAVARRNEFGGAVGGPIVKNKTFFFGSFFALKASSATSSTPTLVTPQYRQFIMNQYPNSIAATWFKSYNPMFEPSSTFQTIGQLMTTTPGSFPVPASWPRDMQVVGTAYVDLAVPRSGRQWIAKVDHNFSNQKDRLSFSLNNQRGQNFSSSYFPGFPNKPYPDDNWMNKLNWTHTFSASLLNETTAAWIRTGGGGCADCAHYELPQASVSSATFPGNSGWSVWTHNDFTWHDALTWMRGRHTLKFGSDIDRQRDDDSFENQQLHPSFAFSNILDFGQDLPYSQTGPMVNALTGGPAYGLFQRIRLLYIGPFVQDDIKVTRNLTLNVGLRFDYFGHLSAVKDDRVGIPQFQYGSGSTLAEQVAHGSMQTLGGNAGYVIPNKVYGLAPRVGFGWDVFGTGKLAIRGGYGMYYNKQANFIGLARLNPPNWAQTQVNIRDANPVFNYKLGPNYSPPPGTAALKIDSNGGIVGQRVGVNGTGADFNIPRTQSWMFSVQTTVANWLLEADYNGTHSDRLVYSGDVNRFAGDLIQNKGVMTRLNSSFGSASVYRTGGISNSNLVSFMANRAFTRSWSLKPMFSVGRATDFATINNDGGSATIVDWMHPERQNGRADYDVKKRFTLESVVIIPSVWRTGFAYAVAGGWHLANIMVLQSGQPFSVYTSAAYPIGDYNADGTNYDFPNAPVFGTNIPNSRSDFVKGVFTKADFPVPAAGVAGNLGRNVFTGPGFANLNTRISKAFRLRKLGESARMEVSGDFFNTLNRVNLNGVSNNLTSTTFGKSTTSSGARQVMFGARINF